MQDNPQRSSVFLPRPLMQRPQASHLSLRRTTRAVSLLGFLLFGLRNASGWEVELNELVDPLVARIYGSPLSGHDPTCAPNGCSGELTRDGSLSVDSRFGCTQQDVAFFNNPCKVIYAFNEDGSAGSQRTISSAYVAFTADSETTLEVQLDNVVVVESWTGEKGLTTLQEIPGLAGYSADDMELSAIINEGSYIGITETKIYIDVDDVPITGISASERVSVLVSATVNDGFAENTLNGNTSASSSWSCLEGDVCEITYDMLEVQSTQQLRIAFVDESSTVGATFNVYTAGADGVFSSALSGVTAGPRDASLEGLQTFGGLRKLARYVKIEGVPGSGGEFSISEVDIRVSEDAPTYPTNAVDTSLVPLGRLPLGGAAGSSGDVSFDPRPASEGGCSAGRLEGCSIFNIKDGDNSPESRWSCSPLLGVCDVEFKLNTHRYIRQLQLAFHEGDERHNEFSIHVRGEVGWTNVLPSAISSGDSTDFQTWDISAWTNAIQIRPKFGSITEWISIKEMILLEQQQSSSSTPVRSYFNAETDYSSDLLPIEDLKTKFSFDLQNVGSIGAIVVGGRGQTARIWALEFKFAPNKAFTFDVRYDVDDDTEISTRFTSAGGSRRWEKFVLPERVMLGRLEIVAVEGPDIEDYPTLRVSDCRVLGKPYSPGSTWVVSTMIEEWDLIPDYIGDGSGDQEEIMQAICNGIGQGFDGTDCDGVATGNDEAPEVNLVSGDYYLDGPVFLKSGINLVGIVSDDAPSSVFNVHGSGTGADGVINADGVSGALVENMRMYSNLESAGAAGTVGNVCLDIKDSEDIVINDFVAYDCPLAIARFTGSDRITGNELGDRSQEGPELILDGVTDVTITKSGLDGVSIKDSVNILFEGLVEDGDFYGSIGVPDGGDQSANLVVSGTSSGVTLKNFSIHPDAEPRIILENSNTFTIDGVDMFGGTPGDCVIQFPQGSDGNAILIQLNVMTELTIEDNCFVLV